jgi:transposase
MRRQNAVATVYGIDLGKTYFHVVGTDPTGKPVRRAKLTRNNFFEFFANVAMAIIGMEACPGPQWLAMKPLAAHVKIVVP